MINSIIDAISVTLNAEFGDDYKIHTESIEQGLQEPCFFVQCINPTSERFLGNKFKRTNQFCIQYFPSTEDKYNECMSVTERLFLALDRVDDWLASKMNSEIVDGVLNFFVNYDGFVYKTTEQTLMETMKHHGRVTQ